MTPKRFLLALGLASAACAPMASAAAQSFLIGDEGNENLLRVSPGSKALNWKVPLAGNRDLQLIGGNRVLANTEDGFREIDLATGATLKTTTYTGIGALMGMRRLKDGRTVVGANGPNGVVFAFLSAGGKEQKKVTVPLAGPLFRMFRYTESGHFLFGSNAQVVECDSTGKILRNVSVTSPAGLRVTAYKVVKRADGTLLATTGYARSLVEIAPNGTIKEVVAAASVKSNFYNDMQLMADGRFFMTDWWGHGKGNGGKGVMLREFDANGKAAWGWQDSALVSSAHAFIVLDGLNTDLLHDDPAGRQMEVATAAIRLLRADRNRFKSITGLLQARSDALGRKQRPLFP